MSELEALIADARVLAQGVAIETEAVRQLQICNACRYCEGFCAVFPAMTRRLSFQKADLHYMANLCHNCGACLHACQYAPPHAFGVNIPETMARLRGETYREYAWPRPLGSFYRHNGLALVFLLVAALTLLLMWAASMRGLSLFEVSGLNFYDVFPHQLLVNIFAPVFLFSTFAIVMGVRQFLNDVTPVTGSTQSATGARLDAAQSILTLRYLDGGHGDGCNNQDDAFTHARRHAHHLTFYGFLLCLAATSVATVYHYVFGWVAPYELSSLPKLLGVFGGVMLFAGATALLWLNLCRHPKQGDAEQRPIDRGFIALLMLISSSGLGLYLASGSACMSIWLCVHLASVMALFLTLPYGKMAHGFYRSAALLRYAVEKRLPNTLGLGGD